MEDVRVGRAIRALRRRANLRQVDVGQKAGLTQSTISLAERGRVDGLSLGAVRRLFRALDADVVVVVRWRGGDLDRLLDERHARLAAAASLLLTGLSWEVAPEVSYSIYGERGSIDLLAFHRPTGVVLVVELKTELTSVEETLRKHDAKVRNATRIGAERFGWRARSVGRLLLFAEDRTTRRRVARHDAILSRAYPSRSTAVRELLARPAGPFAGLLFLSLSDQPRGRRPVDNPKRVRRPRLSVPEKLQTVSTGRRAVLHEGDRQMTRPWALGMACTRVIATWRRVGQNRQPGRATGVRWPDARH